MRARVPDSGEARLTLVDPLAVFSRETRAWFERTFDAPTPAQVKGWPVIATGRHTLIQAPTGSGKTLAAFLYAIDRLTAAPAARGGGLRVLYVSPLKALYYDVERNLRGPLAGLQSPLRVAVRTGDTTQKERAAMLRDAPDILITTPESLFLMLTSRARELLRSVETLIMDEVHAVAGTKRGAHFALSVERLERLVGDAAAARGDRPLRVGRPCDRARRRRRLEAARPGGRRAGRGHARARHSGLARPAPVRVRRLGNHGRARDRVAVDLAVDLSRAARARASAPLDDRLREQPPARRAAGAAVERARGGRGGAGTPRLARPRAAGADRGGSEGGADPVPRRDVVARARDRHGRGRSRGAGRVAEIGRPRLAADRAIGAHARRGVEGAHLPEVPRRPARVRRRRPTDAGGRDRGDADPAQSSGRARAADRRDLRRRGDRGGRAAPARARRVSLRRPLACAARERARHARRPLPVRRVRRAPPADRLGPDGRRRARPAGRQAARRDERGHDP